VSSGQAVAQGFAEISSRFQDAQQQADASIRSAVDQVNQLSSQVASLNAQISAGGSADVSTLIDQRTVAANKLADLVGGAVINNSDGSINMTAGQGRPLVTGSSAYTLTVSSAPNTGFATISSNGTDVTSELTTGQIGGWLSVRDTLIPGYQSQLDQFASDLVSKVNAIHSKGFTATGATNQNFFTPLATVAGAANAIAVDPNVAANPDLVAASASGTAGDNQTANAIAALRNASLGPSGSSASDAWAQLVYRVGSDTADATNSQTTRQQIVDQLGQMRDAASGVSSDEEATNLMKYQSAYEASARYFTTVEQTLDTLMAMMTTT